MVVADCPSGNQTSTAESQHFRSRIFVDWGKTIQTLKAAPAENVSGDKIKAEPKTKEQKEADKVINALRKELAASQKSVNGVTQNMALISLGKGGAGGAGGGKSKGKGEKGKAKQSCWYYNHAECTRGDSCHFSHAKLTPEEKAKLVKPVPSASRATSPANSSPGKARVKAKGLDLIHIVLLSRRLVNATELIAKFLTLTRQMLRS